MEQIVKSIKEFGFNDPIAIDENNVIIEGHGRYLAGKKLNIEELPCIRLSHLSNKQKKAYILAHNKLTMNTGYNEELLNLELMDILELNNLDDLDSPINMDDFGFDMTEYDKQTAEEDDYEIPDEIKTDIKQGDIFQIGEHRLMCGDSTKREDVERLMNGEKADMVFTDPPYGIAFKDNKGNEIKNDSLNDEKLKEFNNDWQENAFIVTKDNSFLLAWQSPRKLHLLSYFGSWNFFRLVTMYKSNRISFPHGAWINKTEPCCIFAKGKPKPTKEHYLDDCYVYKHDKESHEDSNVGHPTPKPVKMISEHLKACVLQGGTVLDLFLGSGSTMVACHQLNRKCYGMELDPKYCQVIIDRMQRLDPEIEIKKL